MSKYLKTFENHSDYLTYKLSLNFIKPNVTYCKDNPNEVHFNPNFNKYLTFRALESGTFKFTGNPINYSLNKGKTWTELASDVDSPTVIKGNTIMFKAELTPSNSGIGTFSSTGNFEAEGNVMSLLFGSNFKEQDSLSGKSYAFKYLFKECTKLINAKNLMLSATRLVNGCYIGMFLDCSGLTTPPQLPANNLASSCYLYMFRGCSALTTAPILPATIMNYYCYGFMFSGCVSLTTAPELPATMLSSYCYSGMFSGCSGLTTAPELLSTSLYDACYNGMFLNCTSLTTVSLLPATTLKQWCYLSMFKNCTSLVEAPEILATTVANQSCIYMFLGCTSLTVAPELPSTTLDYFCYASMFLDCTSLVTAPELPATILTGNCYKNMFKGCTNLNYIKALFTTTPSSSYTDSWVNGVAANGTFVKNSAATWTTTGVNGVPNGWTVQTANS